MTTITSEELIQILDSKLQEKFELNLSPLNDTIIELKTKVDEAMEHVIFVNAKYDELLDRVERLEEEKELLQDENKVLKSSVQQLDQSMALLRQNFNDLEQYSRRECVEISGIPPSAWGEENVNNVVVKIAKLMDVEMGEEDISVCHRLPMSRRHDGRPNQQKIIAKFVRREIKEKFC